MIQFPNAKINIGLDILSKRNDGYHEVETIMFPICLTDVLEIKKTPRSSEQKVTLSVSGIKVDGAIEDNIIYKAYQLLDKDFDLPPVHIHLHKSIPMGAGLGGGSADAAYTLKGLNDMFDLGIKKPRLEHYAARLGSDCAFFIQNKPALATGRGEQLQLHPVDLSGMYVVVVIPSVHISTQEAYSKVVPQKPKNSLIESIDLPIESWKNKIKNDFEDTVFELKPVIKDVKDKLLKSGAIYASLSGSGASVYGIFRQKPEITELLQSKHFTWITHID